MWFIFPQLRGLGTSPMAQKYAIHSLEEAKAYLSHPLLGARLIEACQCLLAIPSGTAQSILGELDAQKLHSSMTLFSLASDEPVFNQVLARFFDASPDMLTLRMLGFAY